MVRWIALAFWFAAIPAFADPIPKAGRKATEIVGTTWEGTDSLGIKMSCFFRKDGVLEYSTNTNTYTNGTCKQDGKKVTWECNGKYAEYEGTIEKDEMKMEAKNVTGLKWSIKLTPVKELPQKPRQENPPAIAK